MSADRPTLPQELIDLILDIVYTDRATLKACARAARSFRHTSQKHIFSHIELVPDAVVSWRRRKESDITLQRFSRILSVSPHLALNVLSIVLVEGTGIGSPPWMRGDVFPPVLSMLVNLTKISITSDLLFQWDSFPPTSIKALQNSIALPSLAFLRLDNLRFNRSTELVSLLQCCRNLDSLFFFRVSVVAMDSYDVGGRDTQSGLSSLALDPFLLPLLDSVRSVLDLRSLGYLQTTLSVIEMAAEAQHILDTTEALSHYHVRLSHHHTDTPMLDLQSLLHLRTLEISISFEFAASPDEYDPVDWAGNLLATAPDPSPIEHVILNVCVEEGDLPYLFHLENLEPFLIAPQMAALRKLTVNLDSFDLDFNIYGGERDILQAFPILSERDMLEIELLGVC
ncbi:hypothetical protein FB451DRAFT_521180 [Mycena latifolia]|nr:hypothetical protein FB451DRAFT_521180 [Mycena latifolia]